jgi:hypothetical protein
MLQQSRSHDRKIADVTFLETQWRTIYPNLTTPKFLLGAKIKQITVISKLT